MEFGEFGFNGHATRKAGHSQLLFHTPGTLTLDLVALYIPLNDISKPICSDSLNLNPLAPLYRGTVMGFFASQGRHNKPSG